MSENTIHRCSICDRTNNYDVVAYPEQYTNGPFRLDPHDELGEVCFECDEAIYDATLLFEEDEDEVDD